MSKAAVVFSFLLLIIASGCKKTDFSHEEFSLDGVKMYDDTLASGENSNIRISSGKDRIFMTYGWGSSFYYYVNGISLFTGSELRGTIISTDMNGDMVWKKTLPQGYSTTTPVELNDGSCIVAAANVWGYSQTVDATIIHLFQFGRNGEELKVDSFTLPPPFTSFYMFASLDVIRGFDDNLYLYGTVIDYTTTLTTGFILKYNVTTGVQLVREVKFREPLPNSPNVTCLYSCIRTSDGGFAFLGTYKGEPYVGHQNLTKTILIKTDANCDTLWTKWFDYNTVEQPTNTPIPGNIIQLDNGGYRFCVNDVIDSDYMRLKSYLYEVNAEGDSVNGTLLIDSENRYCPAIVNNNGNTLALVNSYPVFLISAYSPVFNQINSDCYEFNSSMNLIRKFPIQSVKSDFLTAACNLPDGRIALFGLFGTSNNRSYIPGLVFVN